MKLLTGLVFCSLILGVSSFFSFITEAAQGKAEGGGLSPKATRFTWCGPVLVEAGEARARGSSNQAFPAGFLQLAKEVLALACGGPRPQVTQSPWGVLGHVEAYSDMREANYINADKYFHARRNFDAARRGPGGAWAAEVLRAWPAGSTSVGLVTGVNLVPKEKGRAQERPQPFLPPWCCLSGVIILSTLANLEGQDIFESAVMGQAEEVLRENIRDYELILITLSAMKLFTAIVFCSLVVGVSSESWYSFFKEAVQGTGDLLRAYWDMQFTSSRNSNRYFYARGNYEAAQRGTGGIWVAKIISRMKLSVGLIFCFLVMGVSSQQWLIFLREAGQGTKDIWRAYSDMKEANFKNSDKYFHARGNYDAAQRGPGGAWAAEVISNARENIQRLTGHGAEDSAADQAANEWGRSGKDPNHFRPAGLPDKY
ncbi:Serum amyloid A-3 protein [Tupaia chinensis]|uniref:Serum amyloid A-3 protein n=2 Tax=Tupaia chinensis TaxID=246437 RepID=L9LAH9_TUPCH|nr:Serum amyloid A-3 protein [Tupaia chinensis]